VVQRSDHAVQVVHKSVIDRRRQILKGHSPTLAQATRSKIGARNDLAISGVSSLWAVFQVARSSALG
jgi:hypothetical protein